MRMPRATAAVGVLLLWVALLSGCSSDGGTDDNGGTPGGNGGGNGGNGDDGGDDGGGDGDGGGDDGGNGGNGNKGSPLTLPPFPPAIPPTRPTPGPADPGQRLNVRIAQLLGIITKQCGGELCVEINWVGVPAGQEPTDELCDVVSIDPKKIIPRGSTVTVELACIETDPPPDPTTTTTPTTTTSAPPDDGG